MPETLDDCQHAPGMPTTAETIAAELGGHVRELAVQGDTATFVIVLPDGRVPLLVRDFGHALQICLHGTSTWFAPRGRVDAVMLREAIATTRAWAETEQADGVTLYEIAMQLAMVLQHALEQRWTVSLPGAPDPQEAWLRGPDFDAAAVGVFVGRAMVWIRDDPREFTISTRRELVVSSEKIVAAIREQIAAYRANVALSELVRARAEQLAAKLGERLRIACRVEIASRPSHWQASEARVLGQSSAELARVFVRNKDVLVHAGLVGEDGWEGTELQLDAIVEAIERAARTLTIERLLPGHRYRVLADIGQLREGMVVRFVGFDDIDNHYGVYEFEQLDGCKVGVAGDYSSPRHSPLAQAHRYLESLDDSR
jgi:hypothetical protein